MLIDTHSHLYDGAFDADRADVMRRAAEAGVGRIYLPAIDSESHGAMLDMCGEYPDVCFPMMGLHPTSVNDNPAWREELALVEDFLARSADGSGPKFFAVGEVGLDLYWSKEFYERQLEVFDRQTELSLDYGLPLVVHVRDAWPQTIDALRKRTGRGLQGVMHSFSGSYEDYLAIMECGDFYFGFGGVVTFKNGGLAPLVEQIPLSRIVLETDAPYLTPAPHRGKRNESSYLTLICAKVAEIKGVSPREVAEATTANALSVFGAK